MISVTLRFRSTPFNPLRKDTTHTTTDLGTDAHGMSIILNYEHTLNPPTVLAF